MEIERENIAPLIALCLERNIPCYAYRLPQGKEVVFGMQCSAEVATVAELAQLEGREGFVVHPFEGSDTLFIAGDATTHTHTLAELKALAETLYYPSHPHPTLGEDIDRDTYLQRLNAIVQQLQQQQLKKVVVARTLTLDVAGYALAPRLFTALLESYPTALVSLLSIPSRVAWIGATPELLLRNTSTGFSTLSLAATQAAGGSSWGEKEIEEQEIVSEDIAQALAEIGVAKSVIRSKPSTVVAGKLAHLCTTFQSATKLPISTVDQLLTRLHPTPAVGGLPREEALELIAETEGFDRDLYAGYIGAITAQQELQLFVNIRSMSIYPTQVRLYAGGGITALSQAEDEWEETTAKLQTLLHVIQKLKS